MRTKTKVSEDQKPSKMDRSIVYYLWIAKTVDNVIVKREERGRRTPMSIHLITAEDIEVLKYNPYVAGVNARVIHFTVEFKERFYE